MILPDKAAMQPISSYTGGGNLQTVTENGRWAIAGKTGNCLMADCKCRIKRGALFLLGSNNYGYCLKCCRRLEKERGHILPEQTTFVTTVRRLLD